MNGIKSNNYFENIKTNKLKKNIIKTRNYSMKNIYFDEIINKNGNNSQLKIEQYKSKKEKCSSLKLPYKLNDNKKYRTIKSIINETKEIINKDFNNFNENNNNDINENSNRHSHNLIITELLNKTENYFNKLGYFLDENKKINFTNFYDRNNYKKIKLTKLNINTIKDYKNNCNKKDEKEVDIKDNSINSIKYKENIFDKKSRRKYFKNIINKLNDNNENSIYKTIIFKNKYFNNKRHKVFNLSNNHKKSKKKIKHKNVLPFLSKSNGNFTNKNEIKIAEIRTLYPIYSSKDINNLHNSNDNKFNSNFHNIFVSNSINSYILDNKYNYKNIINNIKYIIKNKENNKYNINKSKGFNQHSVRNKIILKDREILKLNE